MADPILALAERIDQSIADFKASMQQRFTDQNTKLDERDVHLNTKLDERDVRQTRLLDERFKTQTTVLDAAFCAAEKARQEALGTAQEASTRTDSRIKDLEDRMNKLGSRSAGRADVWGWVVAAVAVVGGLIVLFK